MKVVAVQQTCNRFSVEAEVNAIEYPFAREAEYKVFRDECGGTWFVI